MLRKLLAHRLVHFVTLAGVIHLVVSLAAPREPSRVVIAAPEARVEAEVLYREGMRLGIAPNAPREQVIEKMSAIAAESGARADFSDDELRAFYRANASLLAEPLRVRFDYLFVPSGPDARARAIALSRETKPRVETVGPASASAIEAAFGRAVGDAVARGTEGAWSEPLVSAHGFYVVRVSSRSGGGVASFESSRERITAELTRRAGERARAAFVERAKKRYRITVLPPRSAASLVAR
jgi:hypothetical protein